MPGQFESILDKLQTKLGKQTIRKASSIARPKPRPDVIQMQAINDFVRRNPKAGGGLLNGSSEEAAASAFRKKVDELMDDGYDFGEAVREAMRQGYQDGGRVEYKKITKLTDANKINFKFPKDHNYKVQIPTSKNLKPGSLKTISAKTKKELQDKIKKSPTTPLDVSKGLVKIKLPEGAVSFDKTRYKMATGEFTGEGRNKSQIFSLHSKSNPNAAVRYFTSPGRRLFNSIEEAKAGKAKISQDMSKPIKTNVKRVANNIVRNTYKIPGSDKSYVRYKPFIGPQKVTTPGEGFNTLKEAKKFVKDYRKKNPVKTKVRDPEKDYISKDERRQIEKELQGRTIKFGAPKGYVAHHMLPLAGKVDVTDRDIAIISDKMNAELAQFDKPMNKLVKEAFALDFSQEGSLKRMNKINKELADIVKKAEKKLPKKYKGLIGFNKLTPVLGEFDSKGNQVFDIKQIGADYKKSIGQKKKGTPLRDIKTKAIRELVQRAEKMGNIYRSVRPNIDALTNVIPGRADNALAAAIDFPMMYISGAPLTQAAGSAASMFMNNPNLGKAINIGLEQAALSDEEKFLQRATQRREGIESALKSVPSKFQSFIERNRGPADESFTSYFDGGIVSALKGVK